MGAAAAHLSLVRPGDIPKRAPTGRQARELRTSWYQDHPGYGLTPQRVIQIYRLAETGYPATQCDLFDDLIENDGHLRNLFEQRAQGVSGKPWVVQAGGEKPEDALAAQALDKALRRLPMVPVWDHLLTFNRYGYAAAEIDWSVVDVDGRAWVAPVWFACVPARRFRVTAEDELHIITSEFATEGEPLEPGKWIVARRAGARVVRQALMRTAAWFALFKRLATRDWVVYAEKFGLPFVLAKYPEEADEASKAVAAEVVEHLADDGGATLPKNFDVDIKAEGRSGDSSGTHGALINYCNREMSKLINGSTLSNDNGDSGGASYALGDTHDAVRFENVSYDAERLQEAFRVQVAMPFLSFNGLAGAAPPVLRHQVVRDLTPRQRVEIADMLKNKLGIDVSISQLRIDCGFREPIGGGDAAPGAPKAPAGGPA